MVMSLGGKKKMQAPRGVVNSCCKVVDPPREQLLARRDPSRPTFVLLVERRADHGIGHVAGFWWALHASVAGRAGPWFDFEARWLPPGGWIAMTLAYAIAIGLWLGLVFRMGTRPRGGAVRPAP